MKVHIILLILLAAAGCGRYDVQVIDVAGQPVEGVEVAAATLTRGGPRATTNAAGWASIEREPLYPVRWLRVYLPAGGTRDLEWPADWSTDWPVRLMLTDETVRNFP